MREYQQYNDYELIYMIGEKSEDAFSVLYEKYQPLLRKYAFKYYQCYKDYGVEFEDLCQEVYLAFDKAVRYYKDDEDALFYTFLCITVRSRILNYVKGLSSKKNSIYKETVSLEKFYSETGQAIHECLFDTTALQPEVEFVKREVSFKVHKFCVDLDDETSQMFELYWNGFSNLEISTLLDIDFSKVISSLRRARRLLRNYLEYLGN